MQKVKGKEGLVKDPHTGVVVNVDDDAFRQAKLAKKRIMESNEKQKTLEDRVNRLEKAMNQLLQEKEESDDSDQE